MAMTVQQLITRLNKVKDKSIIVAFENSGQTIKRAVIDKVGFSTEKRLWLEADYD